MLYIDDKTGGVIAIDDRWLTIDEIADTLRVHRRTVWGWIRSGQLHAYKAGKAWRVRESDLEQFLSYGLQEEEEKHITKAQAQACAELAMREAGISEEKIQEVITRLRLLFEKHERGEKNEIHRHLD